ncbi:MAG: DHH family phosphoesterase [Spirochaetales bacterium]|nr:DHH family phosphoesterase [Spirochaetales bacterium]
MDKGKNGMRQGEGGVSRERVVPKPRLSGESKLRGLIELLAHIDHVFIQTHNFPDHDAVASAYALKLLLDHFDIQSTIIYQGTIQRDSLKEFIHHLKIPIYNQSEVTLHPHDKILIVDGCKGNKNVTDLIADEAGVIDHHEVVKPESVPWCDIRPELGACCTLVFSYWEETGLSIPREVGTALLVGLLVDTAMMTRGVSREDVSAYSRLYGIAEMQFVNRLLRNNIQEKDLKYFSDAIASLEINGSIGFCYLADGCNQNLLGILGDFFLAIKEIDFVLLCAENNGGINLSMRSENRKWNASVIMQSILEGIGFGGGHGDMAGGIVPHRSEVEPETLRGRLYEACGELSR